MEDRPHYGTLIKCSQRMIILIIVTPELEYELVSIV